MEQVLTKDDALAFSGLTEPEMLNETIGGRFPPPVRVTAKGSIGWLRSELEDWAEGLKEARYVELANIPGLLGVAGSQRIGEVANTQVRKAQKARGNRAPQGGNAKEDEA